MKTPSTITNTQARVMLLKSFVRTGTLLAGARAFAPLSVQRRAFTKMSAAPIGVMVTVEIEESRVPAFLEALKVDAAGSREEEGCLRFDLLKDSEAANTWHFYEIYKDNDAMAVHKTLPHYKAWADFKARFAASFVCLLVFVARLRAAGPRPTVEATAPDASPQHAVDETNQTQAGGGVVSQKVAKFTADDFTA